MSSSMQSAQFSSKKRYVWSDALHQDFIAAVFDVGLKHSTVTDLQGILAPLNGQVTDAQLDAHLHKLRLFRDRSVVPRRHGSHRQERNSNDHALYAITHASQVLEDSEREIERHPRHVAKPSSSDHLNTQPHTTQRAHTTNAAGETAAESAIDHATALVSIQLTQLAHSIAHNQALQVSLQTVLARQREQFQRVCERVQEIDPRLVAAAHNALIQQQELLSRQDPRSLPTNREHTNHSHAQVVDHHTPHHSHSQPSPTPHNDTQHTQHSPHAHNALTQSGKRTHAQAVEDDERAEAQLFALFTRTHNNHTHTPHNIKTNTHTPHTQQPTVPTTHTHNDASVTLTDTHTASTDTHTTTHSAPAAHSARTELYIMSEMRAQMDLHRKLLLQKESQLTQLGGAAAAANGFVQGLYEAPEDAQAASESQQAVDTWDDVEITDDLFSFLHDS